MGTCNTSTYICLKGPEKLTHVSSYSIWVMQFIGIITDTVQVLSTQTFTVIKYCTISNKLYTIGLESDRRFIFVFLKWVSNP